MAGRKSKNELAIAKTQSPSKKEVWAAAQMFFDDKQKNQVIGLVAAALNITPFGINILGSKPYINKIGLDQKLRQYLKNPRIVYEWVKIADNDSDKAICKAKILDDEKDVTDWILGECSPVTMSMKTLNGYQNHMAQTRAKNRAINEVFGSRIQHEFIEGVAQRMSEAKNDKERDAIREVAAQGLGTNSEEEINEFHEPTKKPKPVKNTTTTATVDKAKSVNCSGDCGTVIEDQAVIEFSKARYGKPLCRECQKKQQ